MEIILTKKQLIDALSGCGDNDRVVVEVYDQVADEGLYPFYVDVIDGITGENNTTINEIRLSVIQPSDILGTPTNTETNSK
jgi:hypothetical protein